MAALAGAGGGIGGSAAAGASAGAASGLIGNGKSSGSGSGSGTSSGTSNTSGTSTGGSSTTNSSGLGNQAGWNAWGLGQQIQPASNAFNQDILSALTGGGLSGSMIPMAQAAIAQARGAAGANLGSAENFLARSGAGDSPFAGQLMNSIAAQGNEAAAQAPVGIYQQLLSAIPGYLMGQQSTAIQGQLGGGAQNNTSNSTNFNNVTGTSSQNSRFNNNQKQNQSGSGLMGLF